MPDITAEISDLARAHGFTVAVAESLTGGSLAADLAAAPDSSDWFAGGVVSYMTRIKYEVLNVPYGPVISERAVRAMAQGVATLMAADAAVAVSGCGGPGEQEDNAPGTAWLAVLVRGTVHTELHHFSGTPPEILEQARERALLALLAHMKGAT